MEKDLDALKIDRSRRKPAAASNRWLFLLIAFFVGSLLTVGVFRLFLWPEGTTASPRTAAKDVESSGQPGAEKGLRPVAQDPDRPALIVSGYIVPHYRIEVGSKIVGKVAWVGVEKSDQVKKGQLLVKLDDREFSTQLAQAESTLRIARAGLAELEAGTRPEEKDRALAELNRSQVDLANADREYRRLQSLLTSGVISQQQVDDAEARRDMARAALQVAEKNHQLALLGPRSEQIESARGEVERAQASVAYWRTQISETEIRAPISGTVLERVSDVGEMVSTSFAGGATVVALADLNDLQVEIEISQSDFHNVSEENGCVMSPVAYSDREYPCKVVEIAPQANRQRATIQIKVQILEPDSYLRPEMDAEVKLFPPRGSGAEAKLSPSRQ